MRAPWTAGSTKRDLSVTRSATGNPRVRLDPALELRAKSPAISPPMPPRQPEFDLLVVGAGVNGAGIARDAAGRGLKVLDRRAGRHRFGHVAMEHEAHPRRLALPRAIRVPAGARIAGRARSRAAAGAASRRAAVVRAAARAALASGVDAARRALPVRPSGAARDIARLVRRRSVEAHAVGRRAQAQVREGLRLFRRPRR